MYTFSITIATSTDTGTTHNPHEVLDVLRARLIRQGATIFSSATGAGEDSETGETEGIVIVQGAADNVAHLAVLRSTAQRTGAAFEQRAIGWFEAHPDTFPPSYLPTSRV